MNTEMKRLRAELQLARRDYLLENLYVDPDIRECYDADEKYNIYIIQGLDRTFIALASDMEDTPNRLWVNAAGAVVVGRGRDDPFMPLPDTSGYWYCGDEERQVGEWGEFENGCPWNTLMCIPEIEVLSISAGTQSIIETMLVIEVDDE